MNIYETTAVPITMDQDRLGVFVVGRKFKLASGVADTES
jgi:hypothetical protein